MAVTFESHGGVSLVKVTLVGRALGIALVSALASCGGIRSSALKNLYNRHISQLNRLCIALVIVHHTNRMIVTIRYVNLNVFFDWVKEGSETTGLIESRIECIIILDRSFTVAEPREHLIPKWIYYLYLVVISVSH